MVNTHDRPKFHFSSHKCLLPSNLVLVCEYLGWNWQNSTQKTKLLTKFRPLLQTYVIRKKRHMDFQIIYLIYSSFFCNFLPWQSVSDLANYYLLSLSIVIALHASPKFWQLSFSFREIWRFPTSLILWFINFNHKLILRFFKHCHFQENDVCVISKKKYIYIYIYICRAFSKKQFVLDKKRFFAINLPEINRQKSRKRNVPVYSVYS